ncbi:antibiotic biosynthesis monooxygenase [Vibrio sp. SCSIO 43135]|uniref:antibiotic biosynthesis monooxygenase family protein n=1 Tax=Vibrio sp. SCSIO 43135 TaxID=2819096 RepID=UPI00207511A9|nr:antibiotic biosynthesis monooxygenase family protein [Vibrio sp. SCSIO 43135]USD41751.1 antibiotic biosynthesis monooxygenase [Vibrio sp. SCSIO 43135]
MKAITNIMITLALCFFSFFASAKVILINTFSVPNNKVEETIAYWEVARDFLIEQPGYVSTKLHRSLKPDATYQLINVAEWESVESFQAAIGGMRKEFKAKRIGKPKGVEADPNLYEVIRD